MRVCLAYDCLFPWTVGGQERYFRALAEDLARRGHDVTYLTRRQWPEDQPPRIDGVEVVAVSRDEPLYDAVGRRRIGEAVRYGLGVGRHLLRHRGRYEAAHLVSFPYFSLPAARLALAGSGTRVVVDWPEVWSRAYWRKYLGGPQGLVGLLVQRVCARLTPEAFVIGRLHAERLRAEGMRGPITLLPGPVADHLAAHPAPSPARPLALFVGRLIPEKRARAVPAAIAAAREEVPELRGLIVGDGPDLRAVREEIARLGLEEVVDAPGFLSVEEVNAAFERATCLLAPSSREGYGLVVLEAAAAATPALVVAGEDNAMVERIEQGRNGYLLDDARPETLANGIVRIQREGQALRDRTAAWFDEELERLRSRSAIDVVEPRYAVKPS